MTLRSMSDIARRREAEIQELKDEIERLRKLVDDMSTVHGKLFLNRNKLEEALKSVEYINIGEVFSLQDLDGYTYSHLFCPDCGYKEEDGHWKDCAVGIALHGGE